MQKPDPYHQLVLHRNEGGTCYYLDGRPVHEGDVLEAYSDAGWSQGRYAWSGRIEFSPRLTPVIPNPKFGGFTASTKCRWPQPQAANINTVKWDTEHGNDGVLNVKGQLHDHIMVIRGPYLGHWRVSIKPVRVAKDQVSRHWPVFEVQFSLKEAQQAAMQAVAHRRF